MRSPVLAPAVFALTAAQVAVALRPHDGGGAALAVGGQWLATTALAIALVDLFAWLLVPSRRIGWTQEVRALSPQWLTGHHYAAIGGTLIAVALLRTPHRLVANLICYAVVAIALIWLAERGGGVAAARAAGLAVALFGFVPTHLNVGSPPLLQRGAAGSVFQWTVGWPAQNWALRHDIRLKEPLSRNAALVLALAHRSEPRTRVLVRLNGAELGAMRAVPYEFLEIDVPKERTAAAQHLSFELRLERPDPAVRVVAHRWMGGASLGPSASSFFDGQSWRQGTFDDLVGGTRLGAYMLELQHR